MEMFNLLVQCGLGVEIPDILVNLIRLVVFAIKVIVPIGLVIFGMIDLGQAVIKQKDDEIKKQQTLFVKRVIAAVLVFLVVSIVQLVISLIDKADPESNNSAIDCLNEILKG